MAKMRIRKDDTVVVITGKDKGKSGKVLLSEPAKTRVTVQGVNIATKHKKARSQGEQSGIIHQENPVDVSNVMLLCPKCSKATRVGMKVLENGDKVRICKKCGHEFDK